MAEEFRFFNSVKGDERTYLAGEYAEYFGQFLSTGIYHKDKEAGLKVDANGEDMRVFIKTGTSLINGYMYKNTTDNYLNIAGSSSDYDRIDRVVLRLDLHQDKREIRAKVIQGSAPNSGNDNPSPPGLTRNDDVYEISLAQVLVEKNAETIKRENITDERYNDKVCGLVTSLITIPVTEFQEEWFMLNGPDDNIVNPLRALIQRTDERSEELEYDLNGNLERVKEKDGNNTVKETELIYDEDGNLQEVVEVVKNETEKIQVSTTLSYDDEGNLTKTERSVS